MKRLIFLIVILVSGIVVTYFIIKPDQKKSDLPIINPVDIAEKDVIDPELLRLGTGHEIGTFEFTDQNGNLFSSENLKGKIYVADYFFTECKSICPVMNKQMQKVQKAFYGDKRIMILSFSVDPETDTPKKLKTYSKWMHANDEQWKFLTGKKEDLYQLARKSYFLLKPSEVAKTGDGGSDFIHTNNFVLIDQNKRIRGYYDGTNSKEVEQLIMDMHILLENLKY